MEQLISHLLAVINHTKAFVAFLEKHSCHSYVYLETDDEIVETHEIKDAVSVFTKAHPMKSGNANTAYTAAGVIQIPGEFKQAAISLITDLNTAKELFSEEYTYLNQNGETKSKVHKLLLEGLKSLPDDLPYIIKGLHLSAKQLKRKVSFRLNPSKLSFYKEPQVRREKITETRLADILNGLSAERLELYQDKLDRVDIGKLRYVYHKNHFRYRANILMPTPKGEKANWDNIAQSMPLIAITDNHLAIQKVSDSVPHTQKRADKRVLTPFLPEVNLYEEQ